MKQLEKIGQSVQEYYRINRRVLAFDEYLTMVEEDPLCHARSSAQYICDMFDYFGTEQVHSPDGEMRRFKLFDAPWDQGEGRLIGQEEAQNSIYRIASNFVQQGRVDRFILLHGPNGSSKSTITEMIARGMEYYSSLAEGAIYRFNWIFPTREPGRSGIGFSASGHEKGSGALNSFAYLEDSDVDARLFCEMRDHPLMILPQQLRATMLQELLQQNERQGRDFRISDYLLKGNLCPKCKLVYEALLTSYQGDFLRVLRHVQVERFYISRRYRQSSSRVEPQLAVDARSRQVTADRSLSALPTALQSVSLFEFDGDLVQANRGAIDYPDLLKRNIEAFKYLLSTVEDGRVVLDQTNLFFDMFFIGSSNDAHLNAFMESPDWMSFKGRMELVRVPYLLEHSLEQKIYDSQIKASQVEKHIAPHATSVAALWAVLTRMHKPQPDRYETGLRELVSKLTPLEKAELYAQGKLPAFAKGEDAKILRAGLAKIWCESDADVVYEGRTGASPREIKTTILNASQSVNHACLSPGAVLEELRNLVQETSIYPYLRMDPKDGYYAHKDFIDVAEEWYTERADGDIHSALGLVDESSYADLFSRYVTHVIHYVRKEKLRNLITGAEEDPDEKFMKEVEKEIGAEGNAEDFRQSLLTRVGAWSVDHSGVKPDYLHIFPSHFERLRSSYFEQHKRRITRILQDSVLLLTNDATMPADRKKPAQQMLDRLREERGYCEYCAREAITLLLRTRYH